MKRAGTLLFVGLLLCLPVACDPDGNTPAPSSQKLTLDFVICEPEYWQYVETRSLDVNSDGDKEWIILYYFDQSWPSGAKQHGNPIAAYVYRPDDNCPPNFFAHQLLAPGDDYLCECECTPKMEDVLSGFAGPELVVRDRCDGERMRVTIFQWDATRATYLPQGHFHGHVIRVTCTV